MENQFWKYVLLMAFALLLAVMHMFKYQRIRDKQYLLVLQTVLLIAITPNDPGEADYDDFRIYIGSIMSFLTFGMTWMHFLGYAI